MRVIVSPEHLPEQVMNIGRNPGRNSGRRGLSSAYARLDPAMLEFTLNRSIDWLHGQRRADEQFTLSLTAESSQFWRFNQAKVRQAGQITDANLRLTWICDQRSSYHVFPLSGDWETDQFLLNQALNSLRVELPQLPENPYLVLPEGDRSSHESYAGNLLEPEDLGDAILAGVSDLDFVGIYASGWAVRAYADSIGQSHWFLNDSFSLDYSIFSPNGQAVKGIYAGECWNQRAYEQNMYQSRLQLQRLDRSPRRVNPGQYRTYLAPSAMPELVNMMSWGGVSEADLQQSGSWLLPMRNEGRKLSRHLTLLENFGRGTVPRFNQLGEVAPETLEIIGQGELRNSLISSRTAKEYQLIGNGASVEEDLRAPDIQPGTLPVADVFSALGTGIYVSNLHYLNWSDRPQGRVTGMTRYACFWVEDGEIVAPIEHLRFDDSFYRFWGDNLIALTDTQSCIPNIDTYGHRQIGALWTPGMLIEDFTYTL
jgi:predicted Zn-dependent protease